MLAIDPISEAARSNQIFHAIRELAEELEFFDTTDIEGMQRTCLSVMGMAVLGAQSTGRILEALDGTGMARSEAH